MPFYDSEAIERARQVDLLTYLQTCEPQELVHVSGNVYCTKTHDSLRISNGNGAGFPAGLAVTVRWTISSRSTAIPFGGHGNYLRKGCHPAAFLCASAEGGKAQAPASAPGRPG